jgi:hypothetical protein
MITKTPEELTNTVTLQRKQLIEDQNKIYDLTVKIRALNDTISLNNMKCNENAIQREKVYIDKIMRQQEYVNATIDEIRHLIKLSDRDMKTVNSIKIDTTDSVFTAHSPIIVIEEKSNNDLILSKLDKIKNKINSTK